MADETTFSRDELNDRIARTPATRLVTTRVRVPNPVKARLAAQVLAGRAPVRSKAATRQPGGSS